MAEAKLNVVISDQTQEGARTIKRSLEDIRESSRHTGDAVRQLQATIKSFSSAWLIYKAVQKSFFMQSVEAERAVTQLNAVLRSTKSAAGLTSRQLQMMATDLQKLTTYGDEEVLSLQSILLTFKQIKGDTFKQATIAALDLSTAMGTDLKSAALRVGKALNDPKIGLTALQRAGITFSDSQKELIKQLQKAGDMAGAQAIILKELESQFGGSATAATKTLGGALQQLKNRFGDLFELNATEKFKKLTSAVNNLTSSLDDKTINYYSEALGGLILNGLTGAAKGFKKIADNIDSVTSAVAALSALKLSKTAMMILGVGGGTAGLVAAGIGGLTFAGMQSKQTADNAMSQIKALEERGVLASGSLGKGHTLKEISKLYEEYITVPDNMLQRELARLTPIKPPRSEAPPLDTGSSSKAAAKAAEEAWKNAVNNMSANADRIIKKIADQKEAIRELAEVYKNADKEYFSQQQWSYEQGFTQRTDYLAQLSERFAKLKEEASSGGILDMSNVFNWSEEMKTTFAEQTRILSDGLNPQLELLKERYSNSAITQGEYKTQLESLMEKYREYPQLLETIKSAHEGLSESQMTFTQSLRSSLADATKDFNDLAAATVNGVVDGFARAIAYGDDLGESLKKLGQDIIYTVTKMLIMQQVASWFGGSSDAGNSFSAAKANSLTWLAALEGNGLHSGGIVGKESSFVRHLPKFHSGGINSNEQLAILKKGEGVFTPEQMKALGSSAAAVPNIEINIENKTGTPIQQRQTNTQFDGKKHVIGVVLEAIQNNTGGMRTMLKGA